ncbi:Uncharacterised protein [uncultured archaeon]|nr:Uncharacterised protein [uncultured archaeon]
MPVFDPKVLPNCSKNPQATLKSDCGMCDNLTSVGIYNSTELTVTCKDVPLKPKILLTCPMTTNKEVDAAVDCIKCTKFKGLTFYGQTKINLICSFGEKLPQSFMCMKCATLIDDPEEQVWAEAYRDYHKSQDIVCHKCAGVEGPPFVYPGEEHDMDLEETEE